jgi:CRP/FNR family transcriptional regulator, cyclic AMP receptor protein
MNYTRGWPIEPVSRSAKSAAATLARITLTKRQELLSTVPLFADLKKRELASIARITETARFQPGHEIVVEDTPGDFCCIIVEGLADVIKDGARIARLGPGDLFGELAILDPGSRSATVRTVTEVVAIRVQRDQFLEVATADPRVALRILEVLARRLRETTERLD